MKSHSLFQERVNFIRRKYEELSFRKGWRFLYTPTRTLNSKTKLWLIGLNPGGWHNGGEEPSFEKGNAYRIECWTKDGQKTALQKQICLFYETISKSKGVKRDNLMDTTLAANFCPFRSRNWAELRRKKEVIKFSKDLWSALFDKLNPSVVVCVGKETHSHIYTLLDEKSFKTASPPQKVGAGWGKIKCDLNQFIFGRKKIILVGLPHLSRFRIFGRDHVKHELGYLAKTIAKQI